MSYHYGVHNAYWTCMFIHSFQTNKNWRYSQRISIWKSRCIPNSQCWKYQIVTKLRPRINLPIYFFNRKAGEKLWSIKKKLITLKGKGGWILCIGRNIKRWKCLKSLFSPKVWTLSILLRLALISFESLLLILYF